jgi:hypothetical protein
MRHPSARRRRIAGGVSLAFPRALVATLSGSANDLSGACREARKRAKELLNQNRQKSTSRQAPDKWADAI